MNKARFYYSIPAYRANIIVTTNENGEPVFYPTKGKLSPLSRVTICGLLNTETNVLSFGASVCSAKDRFEKKIGRTLAEDRAQNSPLAKVAVTKSNIGNVFIETALALESRIAGMKNLELKGNM